jgi:hypothetical protein
MTEAKKMGRKRMDDAEKRDKSITSYVTASEEEVVNLLGADYGGASNAIRRAIALLVTIKRPDLAPKLRSDLTKP